MKPNFCQVNNLVVEVLILEELGDGGFYEVVMRVGLEVAGEF